VRTQSNLNSELFFGTFNIFDNFYFLYPLFAQKRLLKVNQTEPIYFNELEIVL
jgi:hypothetical protein